MNVINPFENNINKDIINKNPDEKIIKDDSLYSIIVEKINKFYGKKQILFDVSFKVKKGTIHGFIGPNGAGKSTTLDSLFKLKKITSGDIYFDGKSIFKNDYFNEDAVYIDSDGDKEMDISVEDYVINFNILRGLDKKKIVKKFSESILFPHRYKKLKELSTGWLKIVDIYNKFFSNPSLIVLDEPTNGLDPTVKRDFFKQLKELRKKGVTILLSSHYLKDLQDLVDDITLIKDGNIVYTGPTTKDIEETYDFYFPEKEAEKNSVFDFSN